MSTAVLPSLPGLEFPWKRSPVFKTRRQVAISGKEVRIADQATPRYRWTLSYSVLRQGNIVGTYAEFATLEAFFENRTGAFDSFLYADADDNAVTGQAIATGDGSTKNFPLMRAFGSGPSMPVLAPNLSATINVYLNGVPQASSGYTITPWGTSDPAGPGVLKFATAPGAAVAIAADFSFYFPCRFDDDQLDFEKFMSNLYSLKKLSFTSIK